MGGNAHLFIVGHVESLRKETFFMCEMESDGRTKECWRGGEGWRECRVERRGERATPSNYLSNRENVWWGGCRNAFLCGREGKFCGLGLFEVEVG